MTEKELHRNKLLVKEIVAGNEDAFRALYDSYADDVYGYGLSLLKTKSSAEEIVQEVFLKVWEKRHTLNPDLSFKAYIFTIARNQIFNFIKKMNYSGRLRDEIKYMAQRFHSPVERKIREMELEKIKCQALDLLPPKRRLIFEMSRNEGMSYEDISRELEISISTVKTQMSKALKTIRTFLLKNDDIVAFFLLLSFGLL